MTDTATVARKPGDRVPAPPTVIDEELADQLLGKAQAQGVELLGPDGLLSQVTPRVFQAETDSGDDPVLVYADRAGELDQRLDPAAARGLALAVIVPLPGAADVIDGAAGGPALRDAV
jgi:hypothetical protein